ncbi:hypothetical protein CH260_20205 [Rhodococcus sp. 05-2256-B2]|uniref:hypothetical protein n=1 Tax=unclassified Rhodococcus (in: high G+C Gram-positive bacteria) TaxID=192944 RepID=UPI000B9A943D|nr:MULTISPECIES: hypothetical protein [unclassified Rhodococcus (in: high G+C Gram-positive bacteria)]OZF57750.1 hypothetical protein CH292_01190 [Rhodococcus sp. 14-2470-1a]OZC42570.1 hypothetical protein CH286_25885 [Rhodococcus sp. WWJCD1]OZD85272.1 hypothetical protein CH258_13735 [Rhodococcus sp. 05-2256-B4]OZD92418.1 hypothetical protein CH260_20205 [Rhodococcus sp. 05-2256-B2]OZD99356.1 hypothetical protein CH257_00895 [Rhodococcus sp. 05-2256-B3]
MHSEIGHSHRGTASVTGLLIATVVFGVLLMHSVSSMSMSSMSRSMSGGHASIAAPSRMDDSVSIPVMAGEHDCPSAHQMMHPCVGTPASWPALTVPALSTAVDLVPTSVNRIVGCTDCTLERAPPWTLWELDRSVTLRV